MNGIQDCQKLESAQNANPPIGIEKEKNDIPYGYCQCGCGKPTFLAKHTSTRDRTIKGKPNRYLPTHALRKYNLKGDQNQGFRGKTTIAMGYLMVYTPGHPRATKQGRVPNSRLVSEKALGKYLPKYAIVHHIDSITTNDKNNNLVVCNSVAYHNLLHMRQRAFNKSGHAKWRPCRYCGNYDSPDNLYFPPTTRSYEESPRHVQCFTNYMKNYRKRK